MLRFTRCAGALLVVATLAACGPAPKPPDIYLVVLDALRADRLGAAGYALPTTPTLDALAANGVRFETVYSASTWTKPAMASLFVSRYPLEHGLMDYPASGPGRLVARKLDESFTTLAEALRGRGYDTGAVVNQVHLRSGSGFEQGFDRYASFRGRDANRVAGRAVQMVEKQQETEAPVFTWIHFLDVHAPYTRKLKSTTGAFGPSDLSRRMPMDRGAFLEWEAAGPSGGEARSLSAAYDEEISFLDAALGEMFRQFGERGWLDDAVVVVTADHGEGFGEHGRFQHGFAPYEEVARVPLIVSAPERFDFPAGVRSGVVSLLDVAPTLLDLAGAPPEASYRGVSLVPALRGRTPPERPQLVQTIYGSAWVSGGRKLLVLPERRLELYDLRADPAETRDLAADGCEGPCRKMLADLRAWEKGLELPPHVTDEELTDEDRAELEALGYL